MWRVQVICQISTASVSFIASSIVAIMVARSKTSTRSAGGNTNNSNPQPYPHTNNRTRRNRTTTTIGLMSSPYHRIIFGISISDILQSFAILTGPFAAPADVPQALWGAGNNFTCAMNGVMTIIGSRCTAMYTFFLCYFCLCKVKKNMTDDTFSRKIEWKLHKFIIAFCFTVVVAALVTKTLNSSMHGNFCNNSAVPTGCRQSPDIYGECDETIARNTTILVFVNFLASLLCLVGIIICMAKICWHVMITTYTHTSTGGKSTVRGSSQDGIQENLSLKQHHELER